MVGRLQGAPERVAGHAAVQLIAVGPPTKDGTLRTDVDINS